MKKIRTLSSTFPSSDRSKQRGFTLVEIMIAVGIMSTISLALIKINETMNKTSKNMNQQLDATQLMARMEAALRDSTGCYNTFNGRTLTEGAVATTSIRDQLNSQIVAVPGGTFGDLTVTSVTFVGVQPMAGPTITMVDPGAAPATMAVRERRAQIRIVMRKGKSANVAADFQQTVGTQNITRVLDYKFFVDPATPNTIRGCNGNDGEYLGLACDLFSGTLSGGNCRNITVRSTVEPTGVAATFTSRVAIARTAAPDANSLLQVGGGSYPGPGGALPGVNIATGGNSYLTVSDNARQVFLGADTSNYGMVGTLTNHDFVIRANNTERVRVTAAGNVGINVSPTERLHVNGNGIVTGSLNVGTNLTVSGQTTLTGAVNTTTPLNIGSGAVLNGLCYKGSCITSWNIQSTGACITVYAAPNATAYCGAGRFVMAVGVTSMGNTNILCCLLRVQ